MAKFGWCLDGKHSQCHVFTDIVGRPQIVCSCNCHDTTEGVEAHD